MDRQMRGVAGLVAVCLLVSGPAFGCTNGEKIIQRSDHEPHGRHIDSQDRGWTLHRSVEWRHKSAATSRSYRRTQDAGVS